MCDAMIGKMKCCFLLTKANLREREERNRRRLEVEIRNALQRKAKGKSL